MCCVVASRLLSLFVFITIYFVFVIVIIMIIMIIMIILPARVRLLSVIYSSCLP